MSDQQFGDPWTPEQAILVDVVATAWAGRDAWPVFDYVANTMAGRNLDVLDTLRSFPILGIPGITGPSYADVRFDHTPPAPRPNALIELSLSGLARHPLGAAAAQAFVAVLSDAAERYLQTPAEPTIVPQVTITIEDARRLMSDSPEETLRWVGSLVCAEPILGLQHSHWSPDHTEWAATFGREVARYRALTIARYLTLIREQYDSSQLAASWAIHATPLGNNHAASVRRMDPADAISKLGALRDIADSPDVRRRGPDHSTWQADVETVMRLALSVDSPILQKFKEVRYESPYQMSHAPDMIEKDRQRFAEKVDEAAAYIKAAIHELEISMISPAPADRPSPQEAPGITPSIFLVHGHDGGARQEVARFLEHITGAIVVVLDEQANRGQTLVEKFEKHAGAANYAVVLLTPDDVGRPKGAGPERDQPRARQNVVFELGYFFAKLGRSNVSVINDDVEKPSDVDGLVYIPYPNSNWKVQLAKELKAAGIAVISDTLLS